MSSPGKLPGNDAPVEVDADIDNQAAMSSDNRAEGPSPAKEAAEAERGGGLTLADLHLALAPVLQGLQNVQGQMQTVETRVSQKLDHTLKLVKTLDERQKAQGADIQKITGIVENQEKCQQGYAKEMKKVIARLESLEQRGTATVWKSDPAYIDEGGRTLALMMGRWPDDQPAEVTVQKAREYLQKLGIGLSPQGLFTPGVGGGCSILPIEPRDGEDSRALYQRLIGVVSFARTLKVYCQDESVPTRTKQGRGKRSTLPFLTRVAEVQCRSEVSRQQTTGQRSGVLYTCWRSTTACTNGWARIHPHP